VSERAPAVAGFFYPVDPQRLTSRVDRLLAGCAPTLGRRPKALIAPHAGYDYSGPVAARVYAELLPFAAEIRRVVVAGPSHFVRFPGVATSSASCFTTPLGAVPVDDEGRCRVVGIAGVGVDDVAHRDEHSIEVQLPFLQRVLGDFELMPLLTGEGSRTALAGALDELWGGSETVIVVSTDLSHYLPDNAARTLDAETARAVVEGRDVDLGWDHACGVDALAVIVATARGRRMTTTLLDLATSADTIGPPDVNASPDPVRSPAVH
jgi:AmmeMemoRadiSam system protein B